MSMSRPPFDVSIGLLDEMVPAGLEPPEAVRRARAAVSALPGAGRVSADYSGLVPPGLPWLRVYEPCYCVQQDGWHVGRVDGDGGGSGDAGAPRNLVDNPSNLYRR